MSEEALKAKKPSTRKTSKQVLLVLAKKIKIMDEQAKQQRILIDELEDRIADLEARVYDEREAHFRGEDFDWGEDD